MGQKRKRPLPPGAADHRQKRAASTTASVPCAPAAQNLLPRVGDRRNSNAASLVLDTCKSSGRLPHSPDRAGENAGTRVRLALRLPGRTVRNRCCLYARLLCQYDFVGTQRDFAGGKAAPRVKTPPGRERRPLQRASATRHRDHADFNYDALQAGAAPCLI